MEAWIIIVLVIAVAVLLCFLLAIANHSGERFMDRFEELNEIQTETDLMPLQLISYIQSKFLKRQIEIVKISKVAGDSYSKGKLYLSGETLSRNSLASFTVIAHEMGHAMQDQEGKKLKKLVFLRKLGHILSFFMLPSLIAGIILLFFEKLFIIGICLAGFSILIFLLALLIKIITISIEKDASKKAEGFLKEILPKNQLSQCKRLLKDARLTYWGDFLRIILIWTGMSRKTKLFN